MMTIDFREIESFISVVEKGSISAAAAALGVSQPAISKRIARLEEEMGVTLFAKGHKHSVLTPEGRVVYGSSQQMMECQRRVKRELAEMSSEVSGIVRISASSIPGDFILPSMLVKFRKRFPKVAIHVEVSDSQGAMEKLAVRETDIAIVGVDKAMPGFTTTPFLRDELVLIVDKGHPLTSRKSVTVSDVPKLDIVGRTEGSGTRSTWEKFLRSRKCDDRSISLQFGHALAVVNAVIGGAEAGIVSRLAVKDNDMIVPLSFDPPITRDFSMIHGPCSTKAMDWLTKFLLENALEQFQ